MKKDDKDKVCSESTAKYDARTLKRKRIIAVVSVIIAIALMLWLAWLFGKTLLGGGKDLSFKDRVRDLNELITSYGNAGVLVAFGIQVLQVIVSPIPGEVIEIGMGFCFGWFWGSLVCILGCALGSMIIFAFVKKYGIKIVELFTSPDKINNLRFINNEKKLTSACFLLYLIPGTPKDPLIFFFGLTKIKIWDFLVISSIARIPSIVSSTIGGKFLSDGNYSAAILLFVITGLVSLAGVLAYQKILRKIKQHHEIKTASGD